MNFDGAERQNIIVAESVPLTMGVVDCLLG